MVTFITHDRLDQIYYGLPKLSRRRIVVEDSCMIGANVTILPGVRIGKGCIIGAGSVITRDVPPYTVMRPSHAVEAGTTQSLIQKRLIHG